MPKIYKTKAADKNIWFEILDGGAEDERAAWLAHLATNGYTTRPLTMNPAFPITAFITQKTTDKGYVAKASKNGIVFGPFLSDAEATACLNAIFPKTKVTGLTITEGAYVPPAVSDKKTTTKKHAPVQTDDVGGKAKTKDTAAAQSKGGGLMEEMKKKQEEIKAKGQTTPIVIQKDQQLDKKPATFAMPQLRKTANAANLGQTATKTDMRDDGPKPPPPPPRVQKQAGTTNEEDKKLGKGAPLPLVQRVPANQQGDDMAAATKLAVKPPPPRHTTEQIQLMEADKRKELPAKGQQTGGELAARFKQRKDLAEQQHGSVVAKTPTSERETLFTAALPKTNLASASGKSVSGISAKEEGTGFNTKHIITINLAETTEEEKIKLIKGTLSRAFGCKVEDIKISQNGNQNVLTLERKGKIPANLQSVITEALSEAERIFKITAKRTVVAPKTQLAQSRVVQPLTTMRDVVQHDRPAAVPSASGNTITMELPLKTDQANLEKLVTQIIKSKPGYSFEAKQQGGQLVVVVKNANGPIEPETEKSLRTACSLAKRKLVM